MIIGKSLTALGGGGLKPEICVTAKAGALLNLHFKDSSIILKSYQLGASETTHTFVVGVSETAYVIDDVTNDASVEVLVDAVAQHIVEIDYVLWLYKNGDECEDITGGWEFKDFSWGRVHPTGTKNDDNFYVSFPSGNGQMAGFCTVNAIDLSNYRGIIVRRKDYLYGRNHLSFGAISPLNNSGYNNYVLLFEEGASYTRLSFDGTKQYDFSVTGSYHCRLLAEGGNGNSGYFYNYEVGLVKA